MKFLILAIAALSFTGCAFTTRVQDCKQEGTTRSFQCTQEFRDCLKEVNGEKFYCKDVSRRF